VGLLRLHNEANFATICKRNFDPKLSSRPPLGAILVGLDLKQPRLGAAPRDDPLNKNPPLPRGFTRRHA